MSKIEAQSKKLYPRYRVRMSPRGHRLHDWDFHGAMLLCVSMALYPEIFELSGDRACECDDDRLDATEGTFFGTYSSG